MKISIVTLILLFTAVPFIGSAQDSNTFELQYEVYRNYPPVSITKEELIEAHTLIDLNPSYQSTWVREYQSVEILTNYKGSIKKAVSKNDTLTQEQKDHMLLADLGSDISVKAHYWPENNLKHNDAKMLDFKLSIDPENDATYPGGKQQLKRYLKENLIDKASLDSLKQYQLAAVTFTIDEEGYVIDPHVFWTSEDEILDALIMQTICNMPNWKPAEYLNGTKIKQKFVLTLGDMTSCVVPLLNIRRDL